MHNKRFLNLALVLLALASCKTEPEPMSRFQYPETRRDSVVDNYHGTSVADPYRWLEDDRSEETAAWVKAQNELTFGYLNSIPFRPGIEARLNQIWNYERFSAPVKKGERYYFFKNDGLQNQSVMYFQQGLDGQPQVFLDPNALSEDGTVALAGYSFSKDGKFMAYAIARAGSDWNEIRVRDTQTGKDLPDLIEWVKFSSPQWEADGFYYSRYDKPEGSELSNLNENHKVYYHKLGTTQDQDRLVFEDPQNPKRFCNADLTQQEDFLIITQQETTYGNTLSFKQLGKPNSNFVQVIADFESENSVVGSHQGMLYLLTNREAPKYRLVRVDPAKPQPENWQDILPQGEHVLEYARFANGKILAAYMTDAHNQIQVFDMDGKALGQVELPTIGAVDGLSSQHDEPLAFFTFTSFVVPPTIFKLDMETLETEVFKAPELDFDFSQYETQQVFYTSKDGTKVPMFITHKKGITLDGSNPTLLYGYGGFNISLKPSFRTSNLVWLENGGVYAVANLRGGGEYGIDWYKAGTLERKQNVFDDFIAAAEHLVAQKFTRPDRLAINGGSNGGLLVGAVTNQRPDLFAVAIPSVGVLDMLRFHKFTIGYAWVGDYGSSDNAEQFEHLFKYSPLHNISTTAEYPAVLVTTADHDDRVVPAHSFKYIAQLQHSYQGQRPVMVRIETNAGHGAGKPTAKQIAEEADKWAFIFDNMGLAPKYP